MGIYDIHGRLIRTLINKNQKKGDYVEFWDGKNAKGTMVPAGIYFVILKSGIYISSARLIKM